MLTAEEYEASQELPPIRDKVFREWLIKQYFRWCRHMKRWAPHVEHDKHATYEHRTGQNYKRVISMAAAYEHQHQTWQDATEKVADILGASMARNECTPLVYQQVMDILHSVQIKEGETHE